MKKIKLFSLVAAALFAGSTMAQTTVFAYTVAEGTAKDASNISTTGGMVTLNVNAVETKNNNLGAKLSSDSYYVLCTLDGGATLQTDDVIELKIFQNSTSTPAENTYGVTVASAMENVTTFDGTVYVKAADGKGVATGSFTVGADLNGKSTFYIRRNSGSSMYFQAITISRSTATEPICPSGLTITGDEQVYAGDKMTLTATLAAGNGEIAYQWYKDGTAAENAIAGATNKSYVVESFSAADAGSYYCQASKVDCDATINAEAFVVALKEIKNITCESDKYVAEAGTIIEDRMTITTPSVKLTFGEGAGWTEVKTEPTAPAGYSALIVGSSNPTVSSNKVPTAGCYYKFEVSKSATLKVAVMVNAGKPLYVIKGTESIGYTLAGTEYTAGSTISDATYDILSIEVDAETPYYVYCKGSKLGIYGFEIPGEDIGAALNQVQAEVKAVKVIRDGQLLIIREGKTYTAQGVELQ